MRGASCRRNFRRRRFRGGGAAGRPVTDSVPEERRANGGTGMDAELREDAFRVTPGGVDAHHQGDRDLLRRSSERELECHRDLARREAIAGLEFGVSHWRRRQALQGDQHDDAMGKKRGDSRRLYAT